MELTETEMYFVDKQRAVICLSTGESGGTYRYSYVPGESFPVAPVWFDRTKMKPHSSADRHRAEAYQEIIFAHVVDRCGENFSTARELWYRLADTIQFPVLIPS